VHACGRDKGTHELNALLNLLSREPVVAALAHHVAALNSQLSWVASAHGMTLSLWDFSHPSVRATARHPTHGTAAIDCVVRGLHSVDLHAYHWIDDHAQQVRLSRDARFLGLLDAAALREATANAIAFVLSPRKASTFQVSALSTIAEELRVADDEFWAEFAVLR
jgi:hypothetical protein